jgi:phage terminase large subunit
MKEPRRVVISPREPFVPYLKRNQRWACLVCHRRAGKTVGVLQDIVIKAGSADTPYPRYAYIGPTYTQAKDITWQYLKEFTGFDQTRKISENELSITLGYNEARIRLYGAENFDRLRGGYLDGVVIDEAGDINPRAWDEVIRPALSDRQGWATFIGTPKGRNAFYEIWQRSQNNPSWYSMMLKASESGLIPPPELEEAKAQMTPESYEREYECSFEASIRGAYYAKELTKAREEGRITDKVGYDRAAPVFAVLDLGIGDQTSIWTFQIIGNEWHWLQAYENSGESLDHYVKWLKRLKYPIDQLILPHDAEQRELQTGKTRKQFLERHGFKCKLLPRHSPDERIEAARVRFNRFWFNATDCKHGIEALEMYRADFDEKANTLKTRPLHDWTSHYADAFGYGVMGAKETRKLELPKRKKRWIV